MSKNTLSLISKNGDATPTGRLLQVLEAYVELAQQTNSQPHLCVMEAQAYFRAHLSREQKSSHQVARALSSIKHRPPQAAPLREAPQHQAPPLRVELPPALNIPDDFNEDDLANYVPLPRDENGDLILPEDSDGKI